MGLTVFVTGILTGVAVMVFGPDFAHLAVEKAVEKITTLSQSNNYSAARGSSMGSMKSSIASMLPSMNRCGIATSDDTEEVTSIDGSPQDAQLNNQVDHAVQTKVTPENSLNENDKAVQAKLLPTN